MSFHTISKYSAICPECGNSMPIRNYHVFKREPAFCIGQLMAHLLNQQDGTTRVCDGYLNPLLRHRRTGKVLFLSYSFHERDKQLKQFKLEVARRKAVTR